MRADLEYLLTPVEVKLDKIYGPFVELIDWEHRDYIDDVFTEIFEVSPAFVSREEDTNDYVLYFGESTTFAKVQSVVKQINEYHSVNKELYETL